jgi:hypothetical protein
LAAAAHKKLYKGNVAFAIRLRTFASSTVNGNLGSIPALELVGITLRRMSGFGSLFALAG